MQELEVDDGSDAQLLARARDLAQQDFADRLRPMRDPSPKVDMSLTTVRKPTGSLQAYTYTPDSDTHPDIAIVIVHQCTAMGGSAVAVHDIANACARAGFFVVAFDMRGAGGSSGLSSLGPWPCLSGCAEIGDVSFMANWVRDEMGRDSWLVGVSAGAPIAGSAVEASEHIRGYIGIAPVLGLLTLIIFGQHHPRLLLSRKPKLWIIGSQDCLTSIAMFRLFYACARYPKAFHIERGAGHFDLEFGSKNGNLHARLISRFISEGTSTNDTVCATFIPSFFTGGPCCIALVFLIFMLFAGVF